MKEDRIAEFRGVGAHQNLDDQIVASSVARDKLIEFGLDADKYLEILDHSQMFGRIRAKHVLKQPLTSEELLFLYEMDGPIKSFGWMRDPKINQIKSRRKLKDDMLIALQDRFDRSEICTEIKSFVAQKCRVLIGNLALRYTDVPSDIDLPEIITGSFELPLARTLTHVKLPRLVMGDLKLPNLRVAIGVQYPDMVHGSVELPRLIDGTDNVLPRHVGKDLDISNVKALGNMVFPAEVHNMLSSSAIRKNKALLPAHIRRLVY